ncbi:unnamed protein product [Rotaria sp. Silwood1]|nr:unnamed protein product [Rotaria sp. Silwood1]
MLLDVVYREDTLWNVIQCVVRNAKSVILTAVFAVIIIYLFAICGYLFIQDDFLMPVNTKPLAIDHQNDTNLLDMIFRDATLLQVTQSVTRNGKSIMLTMMLALVLIYLFSVMGFVFFRDDFLTNIQTRLHSSYSHHRYRRSNTNMKTMTLTPTTIPSIINNEFCTKDNCTNDTPVSHIHHATQSSPILPEEAVDEEVERSCDTLFMCIVTTLNKGLRNGGGIGDVLRQPSNQEPLYFFRVIYDMMFFFIVIIITLNLIFGVIIDNFADLRTEKQRNDEILRNTCFICGLDRKSFDNKHVTFEDHIRKVHNMWNYVYFMVLINVKDPTEYTGPESYVHEMIEQRNLDWFPRMRTSSLDIQEDKNKEDQDSRILKIQMEDANKAIKTLTMELAELQKLVTESRAQKHRMNFLQNPSLPTPINS